jgi:hypothetical protein
VVDDHGKIRMTIEHRQQRRQLRRLHQRVEAQANAWQRRERAAHFGAQYPRHIGQVLQHRTH